MECVGSGAVRPGVHAQGMLPPGNFSAGVSQRTTEAGCAAVQQLGQRDALDAIVVEERRADEVATATGEAAEPPRRVEAAVVGLGLGLGLG